MIRPNCVQSVRLNIADRLARVAAETPERPAVIWPGGAARRWCVKTFRQLNDDVGLFAGALRLAGVERGMRTILMVRPGADFFALTFALLRLGAVTVLIDPGMGRRSMVRCLSAIRAEAFVGIPLAHALRSLHRRAFRGVRVAVTVGRRWFWGGRRLEDLVAAVRAAPSAVPPPADTRAGDAAAILFTTGSTGPPKGVLYEHAVFDAQVSALRDYFGLAPGQTDVATFPLFALFDAALGVTAVMPDMDATRPGSPEIPLGIYFHAVWQALHILAHIRDIREHFALPQRAVLLHRKGHPYGDLGIALGHVERFLIW